MGSQLHSGAYYHLSSSVFQLELGLPSGASCIFSVRFTYSSWGCPTGRIDSHWGCPAFLAEHCAGGFQSQFFPAMGAGGLQGSIRQQSSSACFWCWSRHTPAFLVDSHLDRSEQK